MINEKLDSFGTIIILALAFLLPIFFIPFLSVPFGETKLFLLATGVFVAVLAWTAARLKSNEISIPKEKFVLPLILLPLIALISSLFSGNISNSLIGQGVEVDTALMTLILTLSFGVGIYLFHSKDKIIKFYLALTVSALILFLYQMIRLIVGVDFLSFDMFFVNIANLLGKWNDVAIFAGLITLISITTLSTLRPKWLLRVVFYTSLVASLAMLVIVNFSLVWLILGVISFFLFIRSFLEDKFFVHSKDKDELVTPRKSKISGFVLFVLAVSVLFIFAGPTFERFIGNQLGISQIEARPSWQSTMDITEKVYSDNALFGAGPNNFTKEWLLHKPANINNTPFWNTDFLFGVGVIPTIFITHGVLSVIAWIIFLALFFWAGIRAFVRLDLKPFDDYLSTSSFFSATFLWLMAIFYVPHVTLLFFAFLFSGIFLAVQVQAGVVKQKTFSFNENLRAGFIGIALLFVILVVSASGLYVSAQKFASSLYIEKARTQVFAGDIEKAEENINRALLFAKDDLVYRANSEILLFKFASLINQEGYTAEIQSQLQAILVQIIESGRSAILIDGRNYQNWDVLGRTYETLIPVGVEGAYDNTRLSYERALSLNPNNPRLALNLARTEVLNGNNDMARSRIAEALAMKNDYTDAIFLLSRIEIEEGRVPEAIASIETATLFTPRDPLTFFQLGILKYSEEDYTGSVDALERAVLLDNQYSNARYFLGLSYHQLGRIQDAVDQFGLIMNLNPDNSEIVTILENLRAGRAPFEDFTPPDNDPFEGFESPVEEE